MTPEGKTKNIIKKYLKKYVDNGSMYYFMPAQGAFSKKGVPDFIICFNGKFLSIEAKADGKKNNTSELQNITINKIIRSNGVAEVISNEDEMKEFEEKYLK
jgi:hypothetical protein